ncbi:MAG: effector binding domain-containing protein [Candidatus Hodarchaeales archaeon]
MFENTKKNPFGTKMRLQKFLESSSDDIIELLRCLDHPKRFELVIHMLNGKPETFGELLEETDLQKSALANHLSILCDKGLLNKKEKGIYQITFEAYTLLESIAQSFMQSKFREQERIINLLSMVGKTVEYVSEEDLIMGKKNLEELVKIVKLPAMRVVSFHVKDSKSPEIEAWEKLESWAKPKGLFDAPHIYQIFGFNNPNPTKENDKYGYEFWMTIPDDFELEKGLEVKNHDGGLFAVMSCRGAANITDTWMKLIEIIENSSYSRVPHVQWLEHHVDPYITDPEIFLLDLYAPIEE